MKPIYLRSLIAAFVAASLLGGCSTLKKFTGQRDDKILPGERENILPPDQQVNNDIAAKDANNADAGVETSPDASIDTNIDTPAPCDPKVEVCAGTEDGIDQEASGN